VGLARAERGSETREDDTEQEDLPENGTDPDLF